MRTGWFKFHRQIFDNPICTKDAEYFFVWCFLLAEAKFEEERTLFKNQEIILKKGQLKTTSKEISIALKISESKVNRILKKFENEKQIERQTSTQNTVITILNWDMYQADEKQNDKRVENEWRTSDKRVTNERQTNGKPSYLKEEYKNKRNKEDKKYIGAHYPDNEELDKAFVDFMKMRDKIKKPMTNRAITRAKNTLQKLSNGDDELAIKIIEQSIYHCWQDLYALKDDFKESMESAKSTTKTQLEELSRQQSNNAEIIDEDEINRICEEKGW